MQAKFVLLDRDGVINEDRSESVLSRNDFVLLSGAAEAIALLNHKGYGVLVITNQACIGRGALSVEESDAIHRLMGDAVRKAGGYIERIYVCTHTDADQCDCRKPKPGLIHQARADYRFESSETWMVGDAQRDIEAAIAAGCRAALVRTGKGNRTQAPPGVPVFRDLMHFAETLARVGQAA